MQKHTKNEVINDLKCKSIEAKYIHILLNQGISKKYLYENYIYNYQKNIDIMKNNAIYLENYFKDYKEKELPSESRNRFEQFNDDCAKALIHQKAKKLVRCISSHKKIFNEDTYKYFQTLAELNVSTDFIKNNIAKKIKALDSTELLNSALYQHIITFSKWDLNERLSAIKKNYTNVISTQNNKIIFEVKDFDSSATLGSPMWCIARDNDDFENYRKDSERIMFCYDFNKDPSNNEHKTAYIVNAQGHVTSGYYNDDTFMDSKDYKKYQEYFDKYTEEEFILRLEEKNYNQEYKILLLIANEFEENIEELISEANFSLLEEDKFINFLGKNNENAMFKIIDNYPEILLTPKNTGKFLDILLSYAEDVNYSDMGCNLITAIMSSDILMNNAIKNKLRYTEDFLLNISFSNKDADKQLHLLIDNPNFDFKKHVSNFTNYTFGSKIFELLKSAEEKTNIKEYIKSKPELVFSIINCHNNQEAFDYLSLDKEKDKLLIKSLLDKVYGKKDNVNDSKIYLINKNLATLSDNAEHLINETIKNNVINRPRNLFSMRKDIEKHNINFSKEETLNICSKLIFGENLNQVKKLENIDRCEDLLAFKLAKPFIKGVFGSTSLNMQGLSEFVSYIKNENILKECKTKDELSELIERIELIESYSPMSFLDKKIKNKKIIKNKKNI